MRILSIVSNDIVHDARVQKEARSLTDAGHEVSFLGWHGAGRPGLLGLLGWWRRATREGLRQDFDAIHAHDLDALPIGVRLKKKTGKPLVYDAHEIWPYMIEEDVPKIVTDFASHLERDLSPEADRVIAVNEMVKEYVDGVNGNDALIVRNCSDWPLDGYQRPGKAGFDLFTLAYIGTLHPSRFILESIEVVSKMPGFRLVLGGNKILSREARERCGDHPFHTVFLGEVPHDQVRHHTLRANAILCLFDPTKRINQVGMPNKIYEAMSAGRPSIVTENLPMGELIREERCGLPVPYTHEGLRDALLSLRDDPDSAQRLGRNGLEAARSRYNWPNEAKKLVKLYEGL